MHRGYTQRKIIRSLNATSAVVVHALQEGGKRLARVHPLSLLFYALTFLRELHLGQCRRSAALDFEIKSRAPRL